MRLEGSCHCRSVRFRVNSRHPYPFNLCYCSICRKTAGAGGFAINISAEANTLEVEGGEHVRSYRAIMRNGGEESVSEAQRKFCGECGSALWVFDPRWPELLHPHASAIDTPLPKPPERTHNMLASKAAWAEPCAAPGDRTHDEWDPQESIADWHRRLGLEA
jgi:hypothetical protein